MKNYTLMDVCTQRKDYPDATSVQVRSRMLTLSQYTELARRMIGRFAPAAARTMMLNSDDAISFVAGNIASGDWDFDPGRGVALKTYRGRRGKWAISRFLTRLKEDSSAVSLDTEDDSHTMHDLISDSVIDPLACLVNDDECEERRQYVEELLGVPEDEGGLSESQRRCVSMFYLEGMKACQIAAVLGVRRQAVRKTIERALACLRELAEVPA